MGAEPYLLASSMRAVLAQRLVRLKDRRGRTGIFELLIVTEEIRELIMKRATAAQIHRKALEQGMRSLYVDGMLKVKAGLTTEEEVLRVTEEM